MTFRGGHGRTPGATDSRQGKARGEGYLRQAGSGIKGVLIIALFVVFLGVAITFIADPGLRPWGLGTLAVVVVGYLIWRLWERGRRPSLDESLSDLGED